MTITAIRANVEIITPQIAKEYLAHNYKNRVLSASKIDKYARIMQQGEWLLNGEAIQFSKTNRLLNDIFFMNKELLQQYQTLRNTDAVLSINIETQAGCTKVTNRAMVNKIIDLIIHELMQGEKNETSGKSNI